MKHFTEDFQTALWDTIAEIEQQSCVEIVVIFRPNSAAYPDALWAWGTAFAFSAFTFLMFSPMIFGDYLVYAGPICAFFVGWLLASKFPLMRRVVISRARQRRAVDILARALFQKGGIRHTSAKIGVLIYGSVFEKQVRVLPDRGAATSVPPEEWQRIDAGFQRVFASRKPDEAFLAHLKSCQPTFSQYLPPVENDINELPDNLEVTL